jgi:sarcosine oxidase/L-pipecolate oxidase
MHAVGIFYDLAKALDCVNHAIMPTKLHFLGIQGTTAGWFRLNLDDRKQKLEIRLSNTTQDTYLDWGRIKCGVPQGAILGTLIFIIYINDLPIIKNLSVPIIFSDDTSVMNLDDFCVLSNSCLSYE